MTARTALPAGPSVAISRFTAAAARVVDRALACRSEPDRGALVRLTVVVGTASWHLSCEDAEIGQGNDADLAEQAKRVAKATISQLHEQDRGKLLARMNSAAEENPSYFSVSATFEGESWALRVQAHANNSSAIIADCQGVLEQQAQAA